MPTTDSSDKKCSKCKETKPLGSFYYHRQRKSYMSSCRSCNSKECVAYQRKGYRETEKYVFYQRAYEIKRKCKLKKIPCMDELQDHIQGLWKASNKCFYTGLDMSLVGYQHNLYAMTVDKKNPKLGYVEGNIVLCCSMANRMKQDLTETELVEWCKLIIKHQNQEK